MGPRPDIGLAMKVKPMYSQSAKCGRKQRGKRLVLSGSYQNATSNLVVTAPISTVRFRLFNFCIAASLHAFIFLLPFHCLDWILAETWSEIQTQGRRKKPEQIS
jgi:hypothetical protein